jgi:hypothetical protein
MVQVVATSMLVYWVHDTAPIHDQPSPEGTR